MTKSLKMYLIIVFICHIFNVEDLNGSICPSKDLQKEVKQKGRLGNDDGEGGWSHALVSKDEGAHLLKSFLS